MSSTRNTDAVADQAPGGGSGEFKARIERDEPMTTSGHQPGKLVGNDAAPEFQAQTLPAGTAPKESTFEPQNDAVLRPNIGATEGMPGATSGEVHTGLGQPIAGQSSAEERHDGQSHRKNPGTGLEGRES